jgi:hypothetical protein
MCNRKRYNDRILNTLRCLQISEEEFNKYERCGRMEQGMEPNKIFKSIYGDDATPPDITSECICEHIIKEQCYLRPKGSTNISDIVIVGNSCINRYGYQKAVWGKGEKIQCEICDATVGKKSYKRHQQTATCKLALCINTP